MLQPPSPLARAPLRPPRTPVSFRTVRDAVHKAEDVCSKNAFTFECAAAWETVEELTEAMDSQIEQDLWASAP